MLHTRRGMWDAPGRSAHTRPRAQDEPRLADSAQGTPHQRQVSHLGPRLFWHCTEYLPYRIRTVHDHSGHVCPHFSATGRLSPVNPCRNRPARQCRLYWPDPQPPRPGWPAQWTRARLAAMASGPDRPRHRDRLRGARGVCFPLFVPGAALHDARKRGLIVEACTYNYM